MGGEEGGRSCYTAGQARTHWARRATRPVTHPLSQTVDLAMQHANINSHPLATVRLHAYGSSSVLRALLSVRCLVRHSPVTGTINHFHLSDYKSSSSLTHPLFQSVFQSST